MIRYRAIAKKGLISLKCLKILKSLQFYGKSGLNIRLVDVWFDKII